MGRIQQRHLIFLLIMALIIFLLGGIIIYNISRPVRLPSTPDDNSVAVQQKPFSSVTNNAVQSHKATVQHFNRDLMSSRQQSKKQIQKYSVLNNVQPNAVNGDKLKQLGNDLIGGSVDDKVDAIKYLSQIGTQEQKAIIERYANDPKQELAIRLAAVENVDWETNSEVIINIINSHNGAAEAVIYMAETKDLSEETRTAISNAVYATFFNTTHSSTQLAILDYFSDQDDSRFDDLVSRLSLENFSPEEKADVERLIKEREQAQ